MQLPRTVYVTAATLHHQMQPTFNTSCVPEISHMGLEACPRVPAETK
jgi:hypothetical protein